MDRERRSLDPLRDQGVGEEDERTKDDELASRG